MSQAAFFEDSTATFETRNMYFNRDFRDGTSAQQSKRDEWPRASSSISSLATPMAP